MTENRAKTLDWRVLSRRELSDMPGRCESWTELVRYLGNDQWELKAEGSNFSGTGSGPIYLETHNSVSLIEWAIAADAQDDSEPDSTSWAPSSDDDGDEERPGETPRTRQLGRCAQALLGVCRDLNLTHCVEFLLGWQNGTWPPPPPEPRIQRVEKVTTRTRRTGYRSSARDTVFLVETDQGPAHLYPPNDSGQAMLVMPVDPIGCDPSRDKRWIVQLTDDLVCQVRATKSRDIPFSTTGL